MKLKTLCGIFGIGLISLTASAQKGSLERQTDSLGIWKRTLEQDIFENLHSDHFQALKKYSPLTKEKKDSLFNKLNLGLKEYVNKIYIIDKKDLFDETIRAHVHPYEGTLCLGRDYSNRIFFHESAHIRKDALDKLFSDFSKKWGETANFEYGAHNFYYSGDKFNSAIVKNFIQMGILKTEIPLWNDQTEGPKNGCLTPLSSKDTQEDAANFVECLGYEETPESLKKKNTFFKEHYDEKTFVEIFEISQIAFPLYFADTTDHRYKQKLDLLKEYYFLTKEEHEKLINNLGSLNYLFKEKK